MAAAEGPTGRSRRNSVEQQHKQHRYERYACATCGRRGVRSSGSGEKTMNKHEVATAALALSVLLAMFSTAAHAWEAQLSKHPIVTAVHHHDCNAAVSLITPVAGNNDGPTAFLAGRMLDEGICVQRDPELAADFFARAAELGERRAVLDLAAKAGLGIGTKQDYTRAGELCRAAGLDRENRLATPALGYACTVSNIAGRLLREKLPQGAFVPVSDAAAQIEFTPASGAFRITAAPQVGRVEPTTWMHVSKRLVDAHREIERAWQEAVELVPAPEAAHAEGHAATLSIDVDMTLEQGRDLASPVFHGAFLPGDIHAGKYKTTGE
jgi:hypothetical protein